MKQREDDHIITCRRDGSNVHHHIVSAESDTVKASGLEIDITYELRIRDPSRDPAVFSSRRVER